MIITADKVSLNTLDRAIATVLDTDIANIACSGYEVMKNGVYQVSYRFCGKKASRFVSAKIVLKSAVTQRVAASKTVSFVARRGGVAQTDSG